MTRRQPAHTTIAAGLAAAALSAAAALPAQAATSTGWRIVSNRHFGVAGDYNDLYGVVAPSASDAWAFGTSEPTTTAVPVAEHWNGTRWEAATLPSGLSGGVGPASAPSATDVWAVDSGASANVVLNYNGTTWSVVKEFPETGELPQQVTGVTAFSPTNVWVFGGPGADPGLGAWHLQGGAWTQVTGIGAGITAASALSPTNIWAFGANATAPDDIIEHYDGTAWQVTSTSLDNIEFSSVLAMSPTNVWATGSVSKGATVVAYLLRMNGATWTRIKIPWAVQPDRSASDGSGGLWITANTVGTTISEYVLHRTAAGVWSRSKIGASDEVSDITSIPGTTSLWGAGLKELTSSSNAAVWAYGTLP